MSAKVAEAINAVMGKVGYIQKKGTNSFHNYKFAAIGDVLAELQPAMHDAGLIVIQDEVGNELLEGGSIMTARYAFSLLHKSGEVWPTVAHHTGMAAAKSKNGAPDDKALNKCHTAARKYFLMALFQIPTGDHVDPDADGDVPTKNAASGVKPNGQEPKQLEEPQAEKPLGKAYARPVFDKLEKQFLALKTVTEMDAWWTGSKRDRLSLPEDWKQELTVRWTDHKKSIMSAMAQRSGIPLDTDQTMET